MNSIEWLRLWVIVLGVILAITYIKTLIDSISEKEMKAIGSEADGMVKTLPLSLMIALVWVVQGVRLALSLGFILGAVTLINSVWMVIPLVLLATDSARVLYIGFSLVKSVREGTISEKMTKPKMTRYIVNLLLVAVTLGLVF